MRKQGLALILALLLCVGGSAASASAEPASGVAVSLETEGRGALYRETASGEWEKLEPGPAAFAGDPNETFLLRAVGEEGSEPVAFLVDGYEALPAAYASDGVLYLLEVGSEDATIRIVFEEAEVWHVDVEGNGELALLGRNEMEDAIPIESGAAVPATMEEREWLATPDAGNRLASLTLDGRGLKSAESSSGYEFTLFNQEPGDLVATFEETEDVTVSVTADGAGSIRYSLTGDEWEELVPGGGTISAPAFSSVEFLATGVDGTLPVSFVAGGDTNVLPAAYEAEGVRTTWNSSAEDASVSVTFAEVPALDVTVEGEGSLAILYEAPDRQTDVEIDVLNGSRVPVFQAKQTWVAPASDDSVLLSLTLNGERVPFDWEDDNRFTVPANSPGKLVAVFGTATAAVRLSPQAPGELALERADDGLLLTGLVAEPAPEAPRAGNLLDWLTLPAGAAISYETADGNPAQSDAVIGTGTRARIAFEDETVLIRALVRGDVLGTGVINIAQLTRMAEALNGTAPLQGLFLEAADWNGDGAVDIADLLIEAGLLAGD